MGIGTISLREAGTDGDLVLSMPPSALLRPVCFCDRVSTSSSSSLLLFRVEVRGGGIVSTSISVSVSGLLCCWCCLCCFFFGCGVYCTSFYGFSAFWGLSGFLELSVLFGLSGLLGISSCPFLVYCCEGVFCIGEVSFGREHIFALLLTTSFQVPSGSFFPTPSSVGAATAAATAVVVGRVEG